MAKALPQIKARFVTEDGSPLAGGKVYFYEAGTQIPQDTYIDPLESSTNANPVVLDPSGEADIFLKEGWSYKVVVKTAEGGSRYSADNVSVGGSGSGAVGLGTVFISGIDPVAGYLSDKLLAGENVEIVLTTSPSGDTLTLKAVLDGRVLASATDSTPGFLGDKLEAGNGIELDKSDPAKVVISTPVTDRIVQVSATDTTPSFLATKIEAGDGISLAVTNSPGDERLVVTNTAPNSDELVKTSALDPTPGYLASKLLGGSHIQLTDQTTHIEAEVVNNAQNGEVQFLNGTTFDGVNGSTVNATTGAVSFTDLKSAGDAQIVGDLYIVSADRVSSGWKVDGDNSTLDFTPLASTIRAIRFNDTTKQIELGASYRVLADNGYLASINSFVDGQIYMANSVGDLAPTGLTVGNVMTLSGNQTVTGQKNFTGGMQINSTDVLDGTGKINMAFIPASAITDTFVVASEAAMLAIVGETGDVAVRTDLNKSFILKGSDPSVLGDWQELLTPTDLVLSVDGLIGAVNLESKYVQQVNNTWSNLLSKPTTISGFGITDAFTKTESDTRFTRKSANEAQSFYALTSSNIELIFTRIDDSNVDCIRYDDATNSFHFVADKPHDSIGNAALYMGAINNAGEIKGTSYQSTIAQESILPGGNVADDPVNFRFDQNVIAFVDKWVTGASVSSPLTATDTANLFDGKISYVNLNLYSDPVVIEITNLSIGSSYNTRFFPFMLMHSPASVNVKMELMKSGAPGVWETAFDGQPTNGFVFAKYFSAVGSLTGARFTFSGWTGNTYIREIGVFGVNNENSIHLMRRDGDTTYGDYRNYGIINSNELKENSVSLKDKYLPKAMNETPDYAATTTWYKIGDLEDSTSTSNRSQIQGTVWMGGWGGTQKSKLDFILANRNGFKSHTIRTGAVFSNIAIVAYDNGNNTHSVYLKQLDYTHANYKFDLVKGSGLTQYNVTVGAGVTTEPTGTKVYDSSTDDDLRIENHTITTGTVATQQTNAGQVATFHQKKSGDAYGLVKHQEVDHLGNVIWEHGMLLGGSNKQFFKHATFGDVYEIEESGAWTFNREVKTRNKNTNPTAYDLGASFATVEEIWRVPSTGRMLICTGNSEGNVKVLISDDGGRSRREAYLPYTDLNGLYSFEELPNGHIVGVSGIFDNDGYLYCARDGGETWDRHLIVSGAKLFKETRYASNYLWVGEGRNSRVALYRTADIDQFTGWSSALVMPSTPTTAESKVHTMGYNPTNGYFFVGGGDEGTTYGSNFWVCANPGDASPTFTAVAIDAGVISDVFDIEIFDDCIVVATGMGAGKGNTYRTTDMTGLTGWTKATLGGGGNAVYSLTKFENTLYAGEGFGSSNQVWKSIDKGVSWSQISSLGGYELWITMYPTLLGDLLAGSGYNAGEGDVYKFFETVDSTNGEITKRKTLITESLVAPSIKKGQMTVLHAGERPFLSLSTSTSSKPTITFSVADTYEAFDEWLPADHDSAHTMVYTGDGSYKFLGTFGKPVLYRGNMVGYISASNNNQTLTFAIQKWNGASWGTVPNSEVAVTCNTANVPVPLVMLTHDNLDAGDKIRVIKKGPTGTTFTVHSCTKQISLV